MRKYQVLEELLKKREEKIEKVIITVPVTDGHLSAVSQALEIGVSAEYALANVETIDIEELGVEVLFKNGRLRVFESGLGGIYDEEIDFRVQQVKLIKPQANLERIVDIVVALKGALGEE